MFKDSPLPFFLIVLLQSPDYDISWICNAFWNCDHKSNVAYFKLYYVPCCYSCLGECYFVKNLVHKCKEEFQRMVTLSIWKIHSNQKNPACTEYFNGIIRMEILHNVYILATYRCSVCAERKMFLLAQTEAIQMFSRFILKKNSILLWGETGFQAMVERVWIFLL